MDTLQEIIEKIKQFERELAAELQAKQDEYLYIIKGKKVIFEETVRKQHRLLMTRIHAYIFHAELFNILTVPIIWSCLLPALFLDLVVSVFQAICFPVYGIPKVKRSDYVVIDRHALSYLNGIEKINCVYCGYFNGLIAYVQETAARTEQYWCPIKHARRVGNIHSRYKRFFEYGDAEGYKKRHEKVRRNFKDID